MESVKANHLTGKNVIESHARSVTLFQPHLKYAETETGALILLQSIFWKREQAKL